MYISCRIKNESYARVESSLNPYILSHRGTNCLTEAPLVGSCSEDGRGGSHAECTMGSAGEEEGTAAQEILGGWAGGGDDRQEK